MLDVLGFLFLLLLPRAATAVPSEAQFLAVDNENDNVNIVQISLPQPPVHQGNVAQETTAVKQFTSVHCYFPTDVSADFNCILEGQPCLGTVVKIFHSTSTPPSQENAISLCQADNSVPYVRCANTQQHPICRPFGNGLGCLPVEEFEVPPNYTFDSLSSCQQFQSDTTQCCANSSQCNDGCLFPPPPSPGNIQVYICETCGNAMSCGTCGQCDETAASCHIHCNCSCGVFEKSCTQCLCNSLGCASVISETLGAPGLRCRSGQTCRCAFSGAICQASCNSTP